MHDFDYDVMQKKRIAASARHKVNGSKSRFVGLPSDGMTPAQLKKLNGPCETYNLSEPIRYEVFKEMPKDLQQQYLDGLSSRFSVGMSQIGQELFNKSNFTLNSYVKKHGLKPVYGKKLNNAERKLWDEWRNKLGEVVEDVVPCEPVEVADPAEPLPCEKEKEESGLKVDELTATFTGKFEPEKFMKWVAMLPMPEGNVKIRVEVTSV